MLVNIKHTVQLLSWSYEYTYYLTNLVPSKNLFVVVISVARPENLFEWAELCDRVVLSNS